MTRCQTRSPASRPDKSDASVEISDAELDQVLSSRIKLFTLGPRMRCRLLDHSWPNRYRTIRHWLVIVGFLNLLCGIVDCFVLQSIYLNQILVGRVVITIAFWATPLALRRHRTPLVEGMIVLGPSIILLLATGLATHGLPAQFVERFTINACFVIVSGLVFLRLDFIYVCLLTIGACTIVPFAIATSHIEPVAAKLQIILFHVGAMTAILNGQRIMTVYRCRGILLSMQNERQSRQLADLNERLSLMARTDQLTGLPNRRALEEELEALPADERVQLMMIDIDRFKQLNDTLGHAAGDRCLALVGAAIGATTRPQDFSARYGGEEFIVVFQRTYDAEAFAIAERLREAVMNLPTPGGGGMTISIGIATGRAAEHHIIRTAADGALYRAKENGRNRTEVAATDALDHAGHLAA